MHVLYVLLVLLLLVLVCVRWLVLHLGRNAKLYWNSGNYNSPVWNEITIVHNLKANLDISEWDGTSRGAGFFKQFAAVLGTIELDFDLIHQPEDPNWYALFNAATAAAAIELLSLNQTINANGAVGYRASFNLFGFNENEDIEVGMTDEMKAKPSVSNSANPAVYVSAGS